MPGMRRAMLFTFFTAAVAGGVGFIAWTNPTGKQVDNTIAEQVVAEIPATEIPATDTASREIQQVGFESPVSPARPPENHLAQRFRPFGGVFRSQLAKPQKTTDGPPSTDVLAPVGTALRKPPEKMRAIQTPPLANLPSKQQPAPNAGQDEPISADSPPRLFRAREPGASRNDNLNGETIKAPEEEPPREMMVTKSVWPYRLLPNEDARFAASPIVLSRTQSHDFDDDWYVPLENMTSAMQARRDRIRQLLDFYFTKPLNTQEHSPWSIMHTMIGWGIDAQVRVGGPQGRMVNATTWLANNGISDGVQLLTVKEEEIRANNGPGLQGHDAQFLAMLAQTRVDPRIPISVLDKDFQIIDLIRSEQTTCQPSAELTFKLIGLSHYLTSDATWMAGDSQWDIPRLIRAEITAPINGVTCGGTHRLMSLKYAARKRRAEGKPVDGQWARAEKYTSDYVRHSFALQNRDGSFSSNFYRGKGEWGDNDRKMKTTGHALELVLFCVDSDQLQDRRITASVDYLWQMMARNRYNDWPKGPLGHALRALSLYDERVYGRAPGHRSRAVARRAALERKNGANRK